MHVSGQSAARAWSWLRLAIRSAVNADRGKRQRIRAAISLKHLLVGERMPADALQLPLQVDNSVVLVMTEPVIIGFDQPERLALAEPEHQDQHP
jgi:hypothetical protein